MLGNMHIKFSVFLSLPALNVVYSVYRWYNLDVLKFVSHLSLCHLQPHYLVQGKGDKLFLE